jgi:N6-adenosine-specific RNA methylase IME4
VRVWGFAPKTVWTWCKIDVEGKPRLGAGNWGRGGTEHVIVAIKGQPKGDFARVANWFTAPAREHSRKPDEFFTRVEACCAHPAKLELFAREHREGWTTSGAEGGQFAAPATVAIARGANDRAPEAA